MARTPEAIEAEIKALEAAGQGESAAAKALWAELEMVAPQEPIADLGADAMSEAAKRASDGSVLDHDEWQFVQKCLAEMDIQFGKGMTSGAVKKIYNNLMQRLICWRIARDIMVEVGVGNEWPQWSLLNRDEGTGRKLGPRKPAPPPPAQHQAAPVVAGVTEGGMPIHPRMPLDPVEQEKALLRNMMGGMVGSRGEPAVRSAAPVA